MSYVLAIDVGTSFTAAALARPDQGTPPEVLPLGLHGSAVPSVLFYADDGRVLVGEAAERRGLDDPHHMVREFKRRIGDSVPLAVGEGWLTAEDVYATMAAWVVDRAREREGSEPSSIIMTHPAAWGAHRVSSVLAALDLAGLPDITLISEPEAAALHYASQTRVEDGSIIAVYDLGGGTFDTAILRKAGAGNFELLGRPDGIETLGGADFDAAVLRHVMGHVSPAADMDPMAPETLAALARLRRECREAKEALSMDSESSVAVSLPGTQQSVRLVRAEFEELIEAPLRETVEALERSLQGINVDAQDLRAVLLIGGSSRIPLVAEMISVELGRPIAVDADPKSSICLGAAVAAAGMAAAAGMVEATGPAAAAGMVEATGQAAATAPAVGPVPSDDALRRPSGIMRPPALAALRNASSSPTRHTTSRPRVRMAAAAAAAAAVLTIATATAAQSPDARGLLATMFGNQAADVMRDGGPAASGGGGSGAGAGSTGETPVVRNPGPGLEASARNGATRAGTGRGSVRPGTGSAGTGTGSAGGSATGNPAGAGSGNSPGAATGGTGSTATPAPGTGTPGTGTPGAGTPGTGTPGTGTPTTGTPGTPGTGTPTPAPTGGAASGPTDPPPTSTPTTPPPVTEPSIPPATPTDPVSPPPPPPPPPPSPEPTLPQPEPSITQAPPPASPEPAPDPVPPPATADPAPTQTVPVADPALLSAV
ncbi:Hsp70 family protein [Paenarthrobacter nicotinovorans]|uniref:Hsp70 family protein n=1 Tax=Paenarthrobacter nicotinovorans TaxID=29320 RepID=UPI00047B6E96|nr:Hsp70 family protein [Paenarthrobacter nicotinovorans]